VDPLLGRAANVTQFNPYLPGAIWSGGGLRQLIWEPLWDIDTVQSKLIPILAEGMAQPVDNTNTKFRVKLREGIRWNDGVEFTADDMVFTSDMLLNTPEIPYGRAYAGVIKSVTAVDKYTFQIETVNPETRIEQFLGSTVTDAQFKIVPKHVWEKVDVRTYQNGTNVGTAPYTLTRVDPQGNWFLFEKRSDWRNTATGIIFGEPKPKYILFRAYGSEENRVMAAIQNDLDILCDITPESWQVLRQRNPNAKAWYDEFPWAYMSDPGGRGLMFNCAVPPYDDADVRWALTLAIDMKSVSLASFSGMLRVSPIILAPTDGLTSVYHVPMLPWFRDFALSDGYKPFNENFAVEMVDTLRQQGIQGLPTNTQAMKDIFGVGWWKYDPDQAERMLQRKGFRRNNAGKWLKPDGTPWQITLAGPSGFEVISERQAYAIVENWQKFGIDAVVRPCDTASFEALKSQGTVDCNISWPSMSFMLDALAGLRTWDSSNVVPIGQNTPIGGNMGAASRFKSEKLDTILKQLAALYPDDPQIVTLTMEFQKELVINAPFISMFGTSKMVPVTTYWWKNFQTANNNFEGPWWWCSNWKYSLPKYEPTGNK
jgi:peptide/nickel transport system substrate-binding protein